MILVIVVRVLTRQTIVTYFQSWGVNCKWLLATRVLGAITHVCFRAKTAAFPENRDDQLHFFIFFSFVMFQLKVFVGKEENNTRT